MSSFPWYVARSAGLVSWGLLALSVLWGLALSTRALGRRPRAPWLLDLHRFLGGLAVIFVGVHLVGLVFDSWVEIGLRQMLVPFTSSWNPLAVSWGVVGLYLLAAVELTSLLRSRIPKRWWKGVHMSSYGLYVVATIHMLTAGTDRHSAAAALDRRRHHRRHRVLHHLPHHRARQGRLGEARHPRAPARRR